MATQARDRLIDHAVELLWERGYTATSPRDVQEAASVGQGSMYHHFKGKADLARHAIARVAERMRADLDRLLRDEAGLRGVEAYLRKRREPALGCRLGRLAQEPGILEDRNLRAPIAGYFDHLVGELERHLCSGQERGELAASANPRQIATAAAATVQGAYVIARACGDSAVFTDAVEGFMALLDGSATQGS